MTGDRELTEAEIEAFDRADYLASSTGRPTSIRGFGISPPE